MYAHLADLQAEGDLALDEFDQHQRDVVRALVPLRQQLVKLVPKADDSDVPVPAQSEVEARMGRRRIVGGVEQPGESRVAVLRERGQAIRLRPDLRQALREHHGEIATVTVRGRGEKTALATTTGSSSSSTTGSTPAPFSIATIASALSIVATVPPNGARSIASSTAAAPGLIGEQHVTVRLGLALDPAQRAHIACLSASARAGNLPSDARLR